MKVAVSGTTGFIGSHVLAALAANPDITLTAIGRSCAPAVPLPVNVGWAAVDVAAPPERTFELLGAPDVVVHLAWGGLPNYLSAHHFNVELVNHYRFLKGLVEAGRPRLVVVGTCYEYGMRNGELDETLVPAPANPYAYAKVALHRQLQFLQDDVPFELSWPRLFYTYGERQSPRSLWPLFLAAVERGDRNFPMSGGEQLRDYLPVAEVADRLARLTLREAGAGTVNICSGVPVSVRTLVEDWREQLGATIALELGHYPYPAYEPMAFWGSSAKFDALWRSPAP